MADSQKEAAAVKKAVRGPLEKSKKFDEKSKKELNDTVDEISKAVIAALIGLKISDDANKRLKGIEKALKPQPKPKCVLCRIALVLALILILGAAVYMLLWLDPICFENWPIAIGCPEPTSASPQGL